MKRFFLIVALVVGTFVASQEACGAFASSLIWQVDSSGNSANGGGFDPVSGVPGTDYSLATTPQITFTDLVVDPTTNTDCTSVLNPFTAAHVGNAVNITSGTGFTVQRVQIMSIAGGIARMDKSLGTLSSVGGNGRLGGALAAMGNVGAVMVAGNVMWVKSGIYTMTTATDTVSSAGTSTSPISIIGYSSTRTGHGDGYLGRTNGNGPLITTNMPAITYTTGRLNASGTWLIIENLNVATGASAGSITPGADSVITRCKVLNSSTNAAAAGITGTTRGMYFDCDVSLTGASGGTAAVNVATVSTTVDSCRISVVSTAPAILCSSSVVIYGNTIFSSGGIGISMQSTSGAPYIRNNTIVGCAGNAIDIITGTTGLQRIIGNMITDNAGFGIDLNSTAVAAFTAYNRTRDNSAAFDPATAWVTATNYGAVTTDTGGEGTDYVDGPSDDYRLIAASPATSAAQPLSASMGALQRDQTGSGSGGQKSYSF